MSGFRDALPHVLRYEGGFVNDPADPGGATNKGITQRVYDTFRASRGLPRQSVAAISDAEVEAIYLRNYWEAGHCNELPWPLSFVHFDACVNAGIGQATKLLQRAARVPDDGRWGPNTAAAVRAQSPTMLLAELLLERLRFYDLLVQQKPALVRFFRGWVNRVLRVREVAKAA